MQVIVGLYAVVVVEYLSVLVLIRQTDQTRVLQVAQNIKNILFFEALVFLLRLVQLVVDLVLDVQLLGLADDAGYGAMRQVKSRRFRLVAKKPLYVLNLKHLAGVAGSDGQDPGVHFVEIANVRVYVVYPSSHILDRAVGTNLANLRIFVQNNLIDLLVHVRLEDNALKFHAGLQLTIQTHRQVNHV